MAEAVRNSRPSGEEEKKRTKTGEVFVELGMIAIRTLVSGVALAAGGHVYAVAARAFGGNPGNVTPLRRAI